MVDQANLNMQELFAKDGLGELPNNSTPMGEWMSVQDASNATRMSMATLRRYMKAKKLKSRRLGRSVNAKVEVFITPEFLPDESGHSEALDLEDAVDSAIDAEQIDGYLNFEEHDQADHASESTIAWFNRSYLNRLDYFFALAVFQKQQALCEVLFLGFKIAVAMAGASKLF